MDDYTTGEPFDMAPPEGGTLFHPYAASEDKAIETSVRSGGEVDEQFDNRTETFAEGPVEPIDPEVDEHDPQEPAGGQGDGDGDGGDFVLWDVVDGAAGAEGGGGNDGSNGGDIILWDIIDGVADGDDAPVEAGIALHEPVIVEDCNIGGPLCDYG